MTATARMGICAALVGLLAVGCSAGPPAGPPAAAPSSAPASTAPPAQTVPARPRVSLPALMGAELDGGDLRIVRVLSRTSAYTRHAVTYRSGRLTISGVMNVPSGRGPFPVLVLAHGYIDPEVYTSGRGLAREQDYLARRGYVVLHTDYRNHAQSDDDPGNDLRLRQGYVEDVANAVLAVKASTLPALDRDRVGLLGRSMGGGLVLDVLTVRPGLVDAAVAYAPVSSRAQDNFERWVRGRPENRSLSEAIVAAYGAPESAPAFWDAVSSRTYVDRITEPLLVHHGTADESCPIEWSRQTVDALRRAGKDATLLTYPGEPHAFGSAWPSSMARTVAFFRQHLTA